MPAIPLEMEPDFLAGNGFGQNFLAIGCGVGLSGLLARPSPLINPSRSALWSCGESPS
jgi:hypothetical protein